MPPPPPPTPPHTPHISPFNWKMALGLGTPCPKSPGFLWALGTSMASGPCCNSCGLSAPLLSMGLAAFSQLPASMWSQGHESGVGREWGVCSTFLGWSQPELTLPSTFSHYVPCHLACCSTSSQEPWGLAPARPFGAAPVSGARDQLPSSSGLKPGEREHYRADGPIKGGEGEPLRYWPEYTLDVFSN